MADESKPKKKQPACGIIRPISDVAPYPPGHWEQVHRILCEAATAAGFEPQLVSDANEASIIQKNIVTNLLSNEVVICDVSSKNANVMLELGLRLAIGKPVVVVKDKTTDYSFDTSPIEHITYPSNLSYYEIHDFKDRLKNKIAATAKSYEPFLKSFGSIEIPTPGIVEVPGIDIINNKLDMLIRRVVDLSARSHNISRQAVPTETLRHILIAPKSMNKQKLKDFMDNNFPNTYYYFDGNVLTISNEVPDLSVSTILNVAVE